jgi:hypothetical protein
MLLPATAERGGSARAAAVPRGWCRRRGGRLLRNMAGRTRLGKTAAGKTDPSGGRDCALV